MTGGMRTTPITATESKTHILNIPTEDDSRSEYPVNLYLSWIQRKTAEIKRIIKDKESKTTIPLEEISQRDQQTVSKNQWVWLYTDGSTINAIENGGQVCILVGQTASHRHTYFQQRRTALTINLKPQPLDTLQNK
ncbi:hypothetical protein PoB_005850000 [Plakobranchus ocellatus]|uniref:Uncharacterized protein n=1 Tax=Plakobranchus ocellatus TaxID=259542 RepID=A0AAV4CK69_9GAST|nr:hypothetical protein PoB_005850000 [Plakobranchus ocellatus]